jgi:hypothetical protein
VSGGSDIFNSRRNFLQCGDRLIELAHLPVAVRYQIELRDHGRAGRRRLLVLQRDRFLQHLRRGWVFSRIVGHFPLLR